MRFVAATASHASFGASPSRDGMAFMVAGVVVAAVAVAVAADVVAATAAA